MDIRGIDFTSRPGRRKPITCLHATLHDAVLRAGALEEWTDFAAFEAALARPGPWIAGLDFPFGQSRRFIETIGWPPRWAGYVTHARELGRAGFRAALDDYRAGRAAGDKEHRRAFDRAAGAISPQKLHGVPVGLMFFEGAPRLLRSEVAIPGLKDGDPSRVAVEAYPGLLARRLIGRRSYKNDSRAKQTAALRAARRDILDRVRSAALAADYGLTVELGGDLAAALIADPTGDRLDALLGAVQAAWAWTRRADGYGMPAGADPLEGWIADPRVCAAIA